MLKTSIRRPVVKKQRKMKFICKSRSKGITFKPKFKNKELAPKLVYMVYINDSNTIVLFSSVHHASETTTHHVNATRLFDIKLPDEGLNYIITLNLHCKGLFVFPHVTNSLVCNPKTKEVITLPQGSAHILRPDAYEDKGANNRVAIGFIQPTQTYKLAQFFYRSYNLKERRYSNGFEVFTMGISKSWRVLAKDPPYPLWNSCASYMGKHVYFDIWSDIDPDAPNAFLSFDLKKEEFSIMYPPYYLKNVDVGFMALTNLGGRLCLSSLTMNGRRFNVFTRKHGSNVDWTPMFCFSVAVHEQTGVYPLAEHRGKLLFQILDEETNRLDCYNVEDGSCEEVKSELVDLNLEEKDVFGLKGQLWHHVSSYEESFFKLGS